MGQYSAFISYAQPDKDAAYHVADCLEKARGLKCWIAPRDVRPGREFGDEIIKCIEASRRFILVLSGAANASKFVRKEVERAVSKDKPIVTIRIEDVLPSAALELFVSGTHWIDAWTGSLASNMQQLAEAFSMEDATEPTISSVDRLTVAHAAHNDEEESGKITLGNFGIAVVVGTVVGVLAVAALLWQIPKPPADPYAEFADFTDVHRASPPVAPAPKQEVDLSAFGTPVIDIRKLKLSETKAIIPGFVQIIVSNLGTANVQEITIGYGRNLSSGCSPSLDSYDGVKKFPVSLSAGDSVTLFQQVSEEAKEFCIVDAR